MSTPARPHGLQAPRRAAAAMQRCQEAVEAPKSAAPAVGPRRGAHPG